MVGCRDSDDVGKGDEAVLGRTEGIDEGSMVGIAVSSFTVGMTLGIVVCRLEGIGDGK